MICDMHTNIEMHEIIINTQKKYFKLEYPKLCIDEFHKENFGDPTC